MAPRALTESSFNLTLSELLRELNIRSIKVGRYGSILQPTVHHYIAVLEILLNSLNTILSN